MQYPNRRVFVVQLVTGASALAAADVRAEEKMSESDPYAKSMGFKLDTTQVDAKRYPRHTVDQSCTKCQLYDGKPGDKEGPCSFFGGRLVSPNGWCRNFKAKKA